MCSRCGFTLIEALITTLILVTGLTGVAAAFSYAVYSGIRVRQQTTALSLLSTKMEELKNGEVLNSGTFVDAPIVNGEAFVRRWQISTDSPQRITVTVFGRKAGAADRLQELARASTLIGPRF